MKLNTFHGVLLALFFIAFAYSGCAYVAPCIDGYGECPL